MTDEVSIRSTTPRENGPEVDWKAARGLKKIFVIADHPEIPAEAIAWWTQEFSKLGIH